MFRSKARSIVIPQYEHGRLAGNLACLWGNQDFERPAVDFDAFVCAVTFHDWHYGLIDTLGIGETLEAEWLEEVRKGVEYWFDDPVIDILVKLHLRRLLNGRDLDDVTSLVDRVESRIAERLQQTRFTRDQFERADIITACCDHLAFDFCFEEPVKASLNVFAREHASKAITITYEIKPGGEIVVNPWPFSVDEFQGIIAGYQQVGYPEKLTPEIIHFRSAKGIN